MDTIPLGSGDGLMDQCSTARHPMSATDDQTNQPGHGLPLKVAMPWRNKVLTGRRIRNQTPRSPG